MTAWHTRVTAACVVEHEGRYLMVEERDERSGQLVFNQPAGHLDPGESILEAALRETREETGWRVQLDAIIGIALYTPPGAGFTYHRTTFAARPVEQLENARIDPEIHRVHWMDYEAILGQSARMRSPLVLASIQRYRQGLCYPLDVIFNP